MAYRDCCGGSFGRVTDHCLGAHWNMRHMRHKRRSPTAEQVPPAARDGAGDCAMAARESRRGIELKCFGVLDDGTTFPLSLIEISYSGCKIATQIALFPGVELQICTVGGRGTVRGRVRWHKDGHAGIEFINDSIPAKVETPRIRPRVKLDASIALRRPGGHRCETALFDLTPEGCKVEFVERPRVGDILWARFDGVEAMEATVAWVEGFHGGLKFTRPIHPAIFDSILARLGA